MKQHDEVAGTLVVDDLWTLNDAAALDVGVWSVVDAEGKAAGRPRTEVVGDVDADAVHCLSALVGTMFSKPVVTAVERNDAAAVSVDVLALCIGP